MDAPLCDLIAAGNDARIDDFTEQAVFHENHPFYVDFVVWLR